MICLILLLIFIVCKFIEKIYSDKLSERNKKIVKFIKHTSLILFVIAVLTGILILCGMGTLIYMIFA